MKEFLKSRISFHCEKWSSCSLWPNMFLNISAIDYFPQRYCAISVSDNHWCEHTREHILRFKAAQDIWTTLIPQVVFKILKMLHQNECGYLLSQKESCITNSGTYKLNFLFHYLSTVRFSVKVKHLWRRARFKACLIHFVWQILPFSRHYGSPSKGLTRKKRERLKGGQYQIYLLWIHVCEGEDNYCTTVLSSRIAHTKCNSTSSHTLLESVQFAYLHSGIIVLISSL